MSAAVGMASGMVSSATISPRELRKRMKDNGSMPPRNMCGPKRTEMCQLSVLTTPPPLASTSASISTRPPPVAGFCPELV